MTDLVSQNSQRLKKKKISDPQELPHQCPRMPWKCQVVKLSSCFQNLLHGLRETGIFQIPKYKSTSEGESLPKHIWKMIEDLNLWAKASELLNGLRCGTAGDGTKTFRHLHFLTLRQNMCKISLCHYCLLFCFGFFFFVKLWGNDLLAAKCPSFKTEKSSIDHQKRSNKMTCSVNFWILKSYQKHLLSSLTYRLLHGAGAPILPKTNSLDQKIGWCKNMRCPVQTWDWLSKTHPSDECETRGITFELYI